MRVGHGRLPRTAEYGRRGFVFETEHEDAHALIRLVHTLTPMLVHSTAWPGTKLELRRVVGSRKPKISRSVRWAWSRSDGRRKMGAARTLGVDSARFEQLEVHPRA